jgi:hypothetical protein
MRGGDHIDQFGDSQAVSGNPCQDAAAHFNLSRTAFLIFMTSPIDTPTAMIRSWPSESSRDTNSLDQLNTEANPGPAGD